MGLFMFVQGVYFVLRIQLTVPYQVGNFVCTYL